MLIIVVVFAAVPKKGSCSLFIVVKRVVINHFLRIFAYKSSDFANKALEIARKAKEIAKKASDIANKVLEFAKNLLHFAN